MGFFRRKSKKNKVAQSQPSYASPWAPVAEADPIGVADTELAPNAGTSAITNSSVVSEPNYNNGKETFHHNVNLASPPSPSPSALYNVITSSCSNGIELGNDFNASKSGLLSHDGSVADSESVWSGNNAPGIDVKFTKKVGAIAATGGVAQQVVPSAIFSPASQIVSSQAVVSRQAGSVEHQCTPVERNESTKQTPTSQGQTEGAVMQFDSPSSQQQESPNSPPLPREKRATKSFALRTAMFREIVRHRGKSVECPLADHKHASLENEPKTPIEESCNKNASMTDTVGVMQNIATIPDSASLKSTINECNSRDEPIEEDRSSGSGRFPEGEHIHQEEEEVESVPGSSCWSFGGFTADEDDEDDEVATDHETATYVTTDEASTCVTSDENASEMHNATDKTKSSANDGDARIKNHSGPPNEEHNSNERYNDEKSNADDGEDSVDDDDLRTCSESVDGSLSFDGSYDDGTLDGTLDGSFDETLDDDASDCDDDVSEGSTGSVNRSVKGGSGWTWFGFGGNREDASVKSGSYTRASSRQSTVVSVESRSVDDTIGDEDSQAERAESVVSRREKRRELKRDASVDVAKRTNADKNKVVTSVDEAKRTNSDKKSVVTSVDEAKRTNADKKSAVASSQSPSSTSQHQSKPSRGVPMFNKSWKKRMVSEGSRGDKSIASEDTPATASVSLDSNKESVTSRSSPKGGKPLRGNPNHPEALKRNAENGQRHLFCVKNSGMVEFTVRQYNAVPVSSSPNHVLIKVEASTVSLKDCINCGPGSSLNRLIPGLHIIGKVHALGSTDNSSSLRVGDRIAALLPDGGGNAKYVSIPNSNAILLPEDARHEDIICLVSNYMTASQCLKLAKKNGANLNHAKVLVTNASRPVGQAIVELALKEGAKVYATAHKMHEEHLTKLGAKCFNVKPKKWLPRLEGKMDVVIDNLCIDGYESSYRALKPTGVLVCNTNVAVKSGPPSFCNAFEDTSISASISTWWNNVRVKYLWSRVVFYDLNESYQTDPETFGNELHRLIYKLQRGEIKPKVAGRVSLNQVPKAHLLIEKGLPNGTVVCLPWKELDPNQKVKVKKINVG